MRAKLIRLLLLVGLVLNSFSALAITQSAATTPLKPVSIQLHWNHQFEFAGIYAALAQGFYAQAGLDVTIKPWKAGVDVLGDVVSRRSDFGIGYSQLIIDYAKGAPIRLVSTDFQYSPVVLIANHPIINLHDLSHTKIMRQEILQVLSLLKMARYEGATDIEERPSSGRLTEFLQGSVDVFSAYSTNEPFVLQDMKVPFYVVDPKSYGIQSYDDLIFTSQALAEQEPELVDKFKQATNEGWRYALAHPEALVDVIVKNYPSGKSREALLAEAKATEKYVKVGEIPIGSLDRSKLQTIATSAKDFGLLSEEELLSFNVKSLVFHHDKPQLTSEEQAYLREHPMIRITSHRDWAPMEFIDEQGRYSGIVADYFHLFEKQLGVVFVPVTDKSWAEATEMALRGELPILSCGVETPTRSQYMNFTHPYLSFPMVLVAKESEPFIDSYNELAGKSIAVVKGGWAHNYLKRNYAQIPLVLVGSVNEGLQAVVSGRVYGLSDNLLVIDGEIKRSAILGLRVIAQADVRYDLAIGVHNSQPLLLSILQKSLDQVSPEQAQDIYNHWVHLGVVTKVDYASFLRQLLPYIIAVLVLGFLWAIWSFYRRQQQRYQYQLMEARAMSAQQQVEQEGLHRKEQAEFFAMITHEIKTPIAMIDGALQSLNILDNSQSDEIKKRKDRIDRATKRLNRLVDRFLQQGKLKDDFTLTPQVISLVSLCELLSQQYIGVRSIQWSCPTGLNLTADLSLLQLALSNLLDNAIKYSEPDTLIVLEVSVLEDDFGQWWQMAVKDEGRGVDVERVDSLFRPYVRGKNLGDIPGVGLGLYMVNKIAQLHNGYLRYQAQPGGRGSIFTLQLPRA